VAGGEAETCFVSVGVKVAVEVEVNVGSGVKVFVGVGGTGVSVAVGALVGIGVKVAVGILVGDEVSLTVGIASVAEGDVTSSTDGVVTGWIEEPQALTVRARKRRQAWLTREYRCDFISFPLLNKKLLLLTNKYPVTHVLDEILGLRKSFLHETSVRWSGEKEMQGSPQDGGKFAAT
jgi:hypothetical protein